LRSQTTYLYNSHRKNNTLTTENIPDYNIINNLPTDPTITRTFNRELTERDLYVNSIEANENHYIKTDQDQRDYLLTEDAKINKEEYKLIFYIRYIINFL